MGLLERLSFYYSGTVSPLIGYGAQGSLAFGANELFKDLISYLDPKQSTQNSGIMPMSHVLLSGVLTGMVSSFALVILFLFSRLQPTTSESYSKKKSETADTAAPSTPAEMFFGGMATEVST